nr:aminoacyl-tRNA synthetase, class 1a, anticodon-binding [Tanacetum cinerariifolium]
MRLLAVLSLLGKMHLWEAISIHLPQGPLMLPLQVHSLEAELHDHKKLFKDVVGNPCAPTVVPPGASGVPPCASGVPPGASDVSPGASVALTAALAVPADSPKVPADSPNVHAGVSSKGKSPMVEEDIPVIARTFRQMKEDRLGKEAAKRLHVEEMAHMERERVEAQRKRQQEVLESAMYYNKSDWLNIRAQVEASASLSKTLLGDDVALYNTGWTTAFVKSFSDEQLKQEFEKIRKVQSHSQIQAFSQTLKRPGSVLEEPSTKRLKSPEAPTPSMPEVPISPAVTSHPSSRTRRKSIGSKHMHKPKSTLPTLDLDAPAQTFLKVVVDEDSDDDDSIDEVWSAVVGWEDLMKLYGLVVQYYERHPAAGAGLLFWGDLQVLFDSQARGKGFYVWQNQHLWEIRSWRLYTLSNVHVLETFSGEVLSMFTDVSYPLSIELMKRMLMHKLEIDSDFVGNDLTIAEQLIQFIKTQLVAAQDSSV